MASRNHPSVAMTGPVRRAPSTTAIDWRKESILDVYNLVLASFLFASPWLFAVVRGAAAADAWISAAAVGLVSIAALVAFAEWKEWLVLALGLWIAVSPWMMGFQHTSAMGIDAAVGGLVMYLAAVELWLIHYSDRVPDSTR